MDHWILQFMPSKNAFDQYDWMTRIFIFCARKIHKIHANSADWARLQFAALHPVGRRDASQQRPRPTGRFGRLP